MPQEAMSRNAGSAMLRHLTECVRLCRGSQADAGAPQLLTHQVHQGGQILHVTISLEGLRVCWRPCAGVQVTRSALLLVSGACLLLHQIHPHGMAVLSSSRDAWGTFTSHSHSVLLRHFSLLCCIATAKYQWAGFCLSMCFVM